MPNLSSRPSNNEFSGKSCGLVGLKLGFGVGISLAASLVCLGLEYPGRTVPSSTVNWEDAPKAV